MKYRLIIDEFGGWDRFQNMLAGLDAVATRHGVGIGAVAIRWVLDQPGVSGVIVGARHARHLDQIVQASALALGSMITPRSRACRPRRGPPATSTNSSASRAGRMRRSCDTRSVENDEMTAAGRRVH